MGWPEFHDISRSSGGVVHLRATAEAAELPISNVRRRAAQESWWWPFRDVAAIPGTVIDARARAHAAVLHTGGTTGKDEHDLAAATRWTAAHLLGVNRNAPTRPQIVIPSVRSMRGKRAPAGVAGVRPDGFDAEVVRSNSLEPGHVAVASHVPTVTPVRLVRDLAPVCERDRLRAIVIDLVTRQQLSLASLHGLLERAVSFPGRPTVRAVLADLEAAGRKDSPLELDVRDRFDAAGTGIPLDRGQVPVELRDGRTIHLDLGILAIRFAIEVDSMGSHSSRLDLIVDAERHNALMAAVDQWRVIRVTWDLLRSDRWERVVTAARQVIREQSQRYLGIEWPEPQHLRGA
jgi:hypothetical protein